ncbi:hypothetical protein BB427_11380 [Pseudoalteromonas sp. BMB]|uniref:transcriptional regulator n=1 Tax=Pseudoalteromonas sp. BMB TaxID=1874619 RepID=UPI00083E5853|nr:YdaS family helix-turn-helix protein [Pseudoalteromonas sp. BMB]ODB41086.1 hypothetical protein BB427_11380 [Pseudoalteromonas sp. BMB]
MSALKQAIKNVGGQKQLAEAIGGKVTQQKVSYWLKKGKVPAELVLRVEKVTGVKRTELRPDVFLIED